MSGLKKYVVDWGYISGLTILTRNKFRISRNDLLSDMEVSDNEKVILPKLDFEIVEHRDEEITEGTQELEQEEFDFPLFSFGAAPAVSNENEVSKDDKEEERGRTIEKLSTVMKVSLRSPSPEVINQERPESYYFAHYSEKERIQFEQAAISADQIIESSLYISKFPTGKVLDLREHNAKVEAELKRSMKKTRPGKKARLAKIKSTAANKDRLKIQKQAEEAAKKKLLKKLHHKRGGKKNKKKTPAQSAKPQYRTE